MRYSLCLLVIALAACRPSEPVAAPAEPPRSVQDPAPVAYASEKQAFVVAEQVVGLDHPWSFAFLPDDGVLITERPGRLRRVAPDGAVSAPITGLPDIFVDGQAGLLDAALSPDYAQDGWVYLAFAEPNFRGNKAGTAVVRGKLRGDALVESSVVYTQEPKLSHGTHVGARLVFDDQGHLFVTQGDNRVGAATAQELDKLSGKIVRIDADGKVPADNPFVSRAGARGEIWSYGHRNVQGLAFRPGTGQPFACEHGPGHSDEVTALVAGGNGGWDPAPTPGVSCASDYCGYTSNKPDGSQTSMTDRQRFPAALPPSWTNQGVSEGMGPCVFLDGPDWGDWAGRLAVGFLRGARIDLLAMDAAGQATGVRTIAGLPAERMRSLVLAPDGALVVATDGGEIWRMTRADR